METDKKIGLCSVFAGSGQHGGSVVSSPAALSGPSPPPTPLWHLPVPELQGAEPSAGTPTSLPEHLINPFLKTHLFKMAEPL